MRIHTQICLRVRESTSVPHFIENFKHRSMYYKSEILCQWQRFLRTEAATGNPMKNIDFIVVESYSL